MPKKKRPTTIEECNAEMERTQTQIRQYENRGKMLDRKVSVETRKERNHRIYFYGGFLDGIVPELKDMTEAEVKDFLYHAIALLKCNASWRGTEPVRSPTVPNRQSVPLTAPLPRAARSARSAAFGRRAGFRRYRRGRSW